MFLVIVHKREAGSVWSLCIRKSTVLSAKIAKNSKIDNSDLTSKQWLYLLELDRQSGTIVNLRTYYPK